MLLSGKESKLPSNLFDDVMIDGEGKRSAMTEEKLKAWTYPFANNRDAFGYQARFCWIY